MIIWLASYPKSGNTLLRSLLSSYFFSNNGIFNFKLLDNIKQFPLNPLFQNLGIDIKDQGEVIKNYIKVQESFVKKNEVQFLKTHSYLFNIHNNHFTNLKNSLGVIYIVRDPRTVAISYSNHTNTSIDKITDEMINGWYMGGVLNSESSSNQTVTYISSWEKNYNSWKSFDAVNKYLLIKYEDIVSEKKEEIFIKILDFVHYLDKKKFTLDKNKLKNVLETTRFEKVQSLEKSHGFPEAWKNDFFYKGPNNDWKKTLDFKNQQKIEKSFSKEMKELEYI
jgi:hypothetical protein